MFAGFPTTCKVRLIAICVLSVETENLISSYCNETDYHGISLIQFTSRALHQDSSKSCLAGTIM